MLVVETVGRRVLLIVKTVGYSSLDVDPLELERATYNPDITMFTALAARSSNSKGCWGRACARRGTSEAERHTRAGPYLEQIMIYII